MASRSIKAVFISLWRRWTPQTRYTVRRNTVSIMKGLAFKPG